MFSSLLTSFAEISVGGDGKVKPTTDLPGESCFSNRHPWQKKNVSSQELSE